MSPNTLKKPLLYLNRVIGHSTAQNHVSKVKLGDIDKLDEETEKKRLAAVHEKREKKRSAEEERRSVSLKQKQDEEEARASDDPYVSSRYGTFYGGDRPSLSTARIGSLSTDNVGQTIDFTARLHHVRSMSAKLAFVLFRQQVDTIQGVLQVRDGCVSDKFVRWAEHLNPECLVHVSGQVQKAPEDIKTCTIHDREILIDTMHVIVPVQDHPPIDVFAIDQVGENEETHEMELLASERVREANRIMFLRTPAMQSVFRIRSTICRIFRTTLEDQGFIEIQTPKLQPAATESGAEVFKVNYFGRTAFLAQSPQLAKQMAVLSDFGRVFEIGQVFRAENSNTHRHLTEYTGLDLEMEIQRDYHEALNIIDETLKNIFRVTYSQHRIELDNIKMRFPHEDLVWLNRTPRLKFKEAIGLLNDSGWRNEDGKPASETEDLGTRAEIRIGQLVKEKYKTDYFIIDKFPVSARPFYTHLDPDDEAVTNSFDIFLRGQEICSGGQRINDPRQLAERMKKLSIDPATMEDYMQGFAWGAPPHAGCGLGLERIVSLLLGLKDIRNASLFPRDPKSLQPRHISKTDTDPFPEADTMQYAFRGKHDHAHLPDLEKLIVNYGDATNTAWLDDRYTVWRDTNTGAAVGYAEENGYALIMGNPLCYARQYPIVIRAFLKYLQKERDLRPIWLLVSAQVEEILGSKLGWRTLTCTSEERIDVHNAKQVTKKERQAQRADIKIHETGLDEPVPEDVKQKCDVRIEEWKQKRQGRKQAHITEVRPWVSMQHRRYLWAEDMDGRISGLVVLHRLAPAHGYQIKFALDFPGAPSGVIEVLISRAIQGLAGSGVKSVTFGVGAMDRLQVGSNLNGMKAKILSHTYKAVAEQLRLMAKSEFREKFGTTHDPVYICYPFMGLGVSGARTLIGFFEDEM